MRALLVLVLLAPSAAACSLAGPPPEPATFVLVPHDGGASITIEIEGRMLGASCDLSNPHLLAEGTFAWLESFWNPGRAEAHLFDLATGEKRVVVLKDDGVDEFGLWDGKLLYLARDFSGALPPPSVFYLHDVATGEATTLPFPEGNYISVAHDGPLIAAVLRTEGYDGPDLVYLYDAKNERFLLEGRPARDLVGEDHVWLGPMGSGWLVLGGVEHPALYDVATGRIVGGPEGDAPPFLRGGFGGGSALADGYAYSWGHIGGGETRIERAALPDGAPEEVRTPAGPAVVGVVPGHIVLGTYFGDTPAEPAPVDVLERLLSFFGALLAALARAFGLF